MNQPNDPSDSSMQKVGPIHASAQNQSGSIKPVKVDTFWLQGDEESFRNQSRDDIVVTEEPMEIRLVHGPVNDRQSETLYLTMRTPGHDIELAIGFLFGEQIIGGSDQVQLATHFGTPAPGRTKSNTVKVELSPKVSFEAKDQIRRFQTNSSCGVCGKDSVAAVERSISKLKSDSNLDSRRISAAVLASLPETLRESQTWFRATGGIHACGLFGPNGKLIFCREDVGRHNAMDKLVGRMLMDGQLPAQDYVLILSGRISFELMQKAITAGVSVVAAVGAPSNIAIDLAEKFGVTLAGFTSTRRFNVYSHSERISK